MPTPDQKRVEQFVGMLGSEHDGERANAARFLHKMAQSTNQSMVEFFKSQFGGGERIVYQDRVVVQKETVYRDRPPDPTGPKPTAEQAARGRKAYGFGSLEGKISTVLSYHASDMTAFELKFLTDIRPKIAEGLDLTPKQRTILSQIFTKFGM